MMIVNMRDNLFELHFISHCFQFNLF